MEKTGSPGSWKGKTERLSSSSSVIGRHLTRRALLKMGVGAAAGAFFSTSPRSLFAAPLEDGAEDRILSFFNTHTEETLQAAYFRSGNYLPDALAAIQHILRDHRTHQVHSIDPPLLDLLYSLRVHLQTDQPFHVISGYRSPSTNAALCKKNRQVAPRSLHILGKAIDIRLPECDLPALRGAALALHGGGVGYYPKSDFIHIDVGPVRVW